MILLIRKYFWISVLSLLVYITLLFFGVKDSEVNNFYSSLDFGEINETVNNPYFPRVGDPRTSDFLFVSLVNYGSLEMFRNFCCHLKSTDTKAHFIILTESRKVAQMAKTYGMSPIKLKLERERSADFGSKAYKKLIYLRTKYVLYFLRMNYKIIITDVDSVWISDPLSYLNKISLDVGGQQDNQRLCGGFLFLNGSSRDVLRLWTEVLLNFRAVLENTSNDIELTEQGILHSLLESKYQYLAVNGFPQSLFPSGHDYFDKIRLKNSSPIVIHNNYLVGYHKKIERFKKFGLWKVC